MKDRPDIEKDFKHKVHLFLGKLSKEKPLRLSGKTWSGTGTLYEMETDSSFAPCVVLPAVFPWECNSQKVKVTLELMEDSWTEEK